MKNFVKPVSTLLVILSLQSVAWATQPARSVNRGKVMAGAVALQTLSMLPVVHGQTAGSSSSSSSTGLPVGAPPSSFWDDWGGFLDVALSVGAAGLGYGAYRTLLWYFNSTQRPEPAELNSIQITELGQNAHAPAAAVSNITQISPRPASLLASSPVGVQTLGEAFPSVAGSAQSASHYSPDSDDEKKRAVLSVIFRF